MIPSVAILSRRIHNFPNVTDRSGEESKMALNKLLRTTLTAITLALFVSAVEAQTDGTSFSIGNLKRPSLHRTTIFIPGILGSRLDLEGNNIWGDFPLDPAALVLKPDSAYPAASPLVDASARLPLVGIRKKVYGTYFDRVLGDLSARDWFHIFSYDWRRSNIESAARLNDFICAITAKDGGEVTIVAHSMGSLVLKLWLMDYYPKGCTGGGKVGLSGIVFVAAPNFGAPKAFLTLLSGKADLFPALNEYMTPDFDVVGLSFDSMFELLPMQQSYRSQWDDADLCAGIHATQMGDPMRARVFLRGEEGDEILNIYSSETWYRLGVMSRVEKLREIYGVQMSSAQAYLQEKLDSARAVGCRILDFQVPSEIQDRVFNVAGRLDVEGFPAATTPSEILVSEVRFSEKFQSEIEDPLLGVKYIYVNFGSGDNTVPSDIALAGAASRTRVGNSGHLEILSTPELQQATEEFEKDAFLRLDSGARIPVSPAAGTPIANLNKAGWLFASASKPNLTWAEWEASTSSAPSGLEDGLDLLGLQYYSKSVGLGKSFEQGGGVFFGDVVGLAMQGKVASVDDALSIARDSGSAEDWQAIAISSGARNIVRAEAAMNAGSEFFYSGREEQSIAMYKIAVESYMDALSREGRLDRDDLRRMNAARQYTEVLDSFSGINPDQAILLRSAIIDAMRTDGTVSVADLGITYGETNFFVDMESLASAGRLSPGKN